LSRLAAIAACALTLASCGGSSGTPVGSDDRLAGRGDEIDVPLGQATCADWNEASVEARRDVLGQLRSNRAQPITGGGVRGQGSVLDEDFAYRLLENRCSHPAADSFLLYKLYGYAAAFAGSAP
jgi:hypothetical protein